MSKIVATTSLVFLSFFSVFEASATSLKKLNRQLEHCYQETYAKGILPSESTCLKVIENKLTTRKNKAIALHNLGVIQIEAGELGAAQQSFVRAVALNKKQVSSLLALAQFNLRQKPEMAQQYISRALVLNPHDKLAIKLQNKLQSQPRLLSGTALKSTKQVTE